MKDHHMNPEEAVQAHIDLRAKKSLAIHFGTFRLTDESYEDPVLDLDKALIKTNIPNEEFKVLEHGQSILF
jgi:N-acyl-phosphatidylethanolamine-hydrolysing phospholipase D